MAPPPPPAPPPAAAPADRDDSTPSRSTVPVTEGPIAAGTSQDNSTGTDPEEEPETTTEEVTSETRDGVGRPEGLPVEGLEPETPGATSNAEQPASAGPPTILRKIPISKRDAQVTFAPAPSPFVFDGQYVIDLTNGERVGESSEAEAPVKMPRALSPDGKAFAVARRNEQGRLSTIRIIATATDKVIHDVDGPGSGGPEAMQLVKLRFTGSRELLAIYELQAEKQMYLYDVTTGSPTSTFGALYYTQNRSDVAPDGSHVLVGNRGTVFVYALKAGKLVADLTWPAELQEFAETRGGFMTFSPNGGEIACPVANRIVCWGSRGGITFDAECGTDASSQTPIIWIPDGSGWIVENRQLVLRESQKVAWQVPFHGTCRFVNQDTLAIHTQEDGVQQIVVIQMPWGDIR